MRGLPGTAEMSQIYRTELANKPTRPAGTVEGATPTTQVLQEQGDHVYTTNKTFEKTKAPGTLHVDGVSRGWREEAARGFVRELTPNPSLQLPVNAPLYGDESDSAPTTTITVSPRTIAIQLSDTLLTGISGARATTVTTSIPLGLIAPPVEAPSDAATVRDWAAPLVADEGSTSAFRDQPSELLDEGSIDEFWQSLATSLEPVVLA